MQHLASSMPLTSTPADQHFTTVSLDRLIADLPDAVDQSMQAAIPHLYTPQKAAEFTAAMTAELRARYAQLTAVSR